MKIFSGNNEYRRFCESIDMIPTSNVESSQKPRGVIVIDKKCSCFSWTKLAVSRFPAVVSWPEASCKHHQYLLYIDKMASGRTACSGTFNIILRRNRWCLHLRRPTVVWRNTKTSPIKKVCLCILLAPNVLLEDHWIMNYDDHPYFT